MTYKITKEGMKEIKEISDRILKLNNKKFIIKQLIQAYDLGRYEEFQATVNKSNNLMEKLGL